MCPSKGCAFSRDVPFQGPPLQILQPSGVITQGSEKIIIGLEKPIAYDPEVVAIMDYRKLARSALLALSVPQDGSEICDPFHVRIGGANAQGEKEIGMICTAACEEYAREKGLVFYGSWVDAVGKCSLFVWTGLISAYSGQKKYPCGIDYYHEARNMRNAAAFLATAFPWGGRVWCNLQALLHGQSKVVEASVCVTNV